MVGIKSLWERFIGRKSDDFVVRPRNEASKEGGELAKPLTVAGGWLAATTAAGYTLGAVHEARDVVEVEKVPYPETVQVQVGKETVHGCWDYHYGYDFSRGEWGYHYGYDPSCVEERPVYETRYTGKTLYKDVVHHSEAFPYTALQGAAVGFGVGILTGVVGTVLWEVYRSKN